MLAKGWEDLEMAPNVRTTQAMTTAGLNLIQQALSIYDSDLKLAVLNQRFRDMFDLPEEFLTPGADFGETIRYLTERGEYGDVDDIDAFVQGRVDQARAFEAHYIEREMPDGRWISVEGSPLPQGGWVAVYTDITKVKQQEQLLRGRSEELSEQLLEHAEKLSATNRALESTVTALEETKRQLTESEARTRLTAEMMPAHIAHVGPDMCYTYSNRRLSSVMPGRPRNILGYHIRDALSDSAYQSLLPHLEAAFEGKASVVEFHDRPSARRIRTALTPDGEAGENRGVYILSMDITEEAQTRAVLQQTRRREIAAQMTSGLAHDFSNLLTIILGMQSKLEKMALPNDAAKLVEATLAAARRGGTLLNRLADMTGRRAPQMVATDIAPFLEQLNTLAGGSLPDGIQLTIENRIGPVPLLVDPGMLQDSLLNLVLNARDACEGMGQISLSARLMHDTWVEFEVCDSGTGFSDEALSRAMDPFFTTKGGEGSGLGLPMVYDMTKLAGGEVKIGNCPQGGGKVTLRLPLRRAAKVDVPGLVLLVEDSPDLRETVRDMLITRGHTVIEATSVDEALALAREIPDIQLVLSDVSLEGEATGVDLITQLPESQTPSFLMTSLPQNHPLYLEAAARAPVLPKPFSAEQLSAFLQSGVTP
jgi:signal transduction histidine kinase